MAKDQLRLYRMLSRAPFPRSYVGKVFFTAFLGTHVPLLALLVYFARRRHFGLRGALRILSVTVPATLGGTAFTLWAMYALSAPTALASRALRRYLDSGELPDLPVDYTDRAGRLMADVQYTIERLDKAVRSLGEQAARDHLTGAYNRRAAEERLAEDVKRAERGVGQLSLALFDLDSLKSINDEYGHRAGDACVMSSRCSAIASVTSGSMSNAGIARSSSIQSPTISRGIFGARSRAAVPSLRARTRGRPCGRALLASLADGGPARANRGCWDTRGARRCRGGSARRRGRRSDNRRAW